MTYELIAIVLGLGVGLSLGALGGGGSTLAVPILVFVAGMEAREATTSSLLVVGIASLIGAWSHYRVGNVRLGAGIAFGVAGIGGSRLGTVANQSLDEDVLLLAFAVLIVVVAARMYQKSTTSPPHHAEDTPHTPLADQPVSASRTADGSAAGPVVIAAAAPALPQRLTVSAVARLALAATAVGVLTGLFGVGGGFVVVPALTLLLGFSTKEAIGTSLVVISINAAIALGLRSGAIDVDWLLVGGFLVAVTLGVLAGTRLTSRIDAERLATSFAVMLALVGVYTAASVLAF